jgi:poly-gamma-glutamate synthesis protein (capsule biosynthesis protein)
MRRGRSGLAGVLLPSRPVPPRQGRAFVQTPGGWYNPAVIIPARPAMNNPDYFPYTWTPEADLPRYARVRAEGLPLRDSLWSGLSYMRKYFRAKRSAPVEEVSYFDEQRKLLRRLGQGPEEGLRLGMVGDLMWIRDGWNNFLSPEVLAYLNGHEVVLGNLESPVSARSRVPWLLPDYFTYNSAPGLVRSFRRPAAGGVDAFRSTFSALATANNHSLDRGDDGLLDTLEFLDQLHIPHAGVRKSADEKPYVTFEAGGIRFGFYAACWGLNNPEAGRTSSWHVEVQPGLAPRVCLPVDLARVRSSLAGMEAEGVDFKIVSLHWGHEFELYPCPEQMVVGRKIIAAGADLLMGTHPHVLQPAEVCFVNGYERSYLDRGEDLPALRERTGCLLRDDSGRPRKGLIAYSLGNFATAMYTLLCRMGMVFSIRLVRDEATGRVDWQRPEVQLVLNVHRDPRTWRRRRLVLLESYLRERERRGDGAVQLRATAALLQRHLFGSA